MSLLVDYDTYKEVSEDLLRPIVAEGLDIDTLKRLYVSKLVYLENLRKQCFKDLNKVNSIFNPEDLKLITDAIKENNHHIRNLILSSVYLALENYAE